MTAGVDDRSPQPTTVIVDVRVFDGHVVSDPTAVTLSGASILGVESSAIGDPQLVVDGGGGVLLAGLIDAHVHLDGSEALQLNRRWGVTTVLDMAIHPPSLLRSLRDQPGLPDVRSAGMPASAPGGTQTTRMGFPPETALSGPHQAEAFVAARVAEGSDYLKIIVEDPRRMGLAALTQPTLDALVVAGRARGLRTVAHASSTAAERMALDAGVDVLTHAPVDADLPPELIQRAHTQHTALIPTLTMMETVVANVPQRPGGGTAPDYTHCRATVADMYRRGVPVLAGTDANTAPGSPMQVPHGVSLHHELELLVDAGLTPVDAVRAATVLPARTFALDDRGRVAPGLRADLILIDGDPTIDITSTRALRAVWCAGRRFDPPATD